MNCIQLTFPFYETISVSIIQWELDFDSGDEQNYNEVFAL